MPQRVNHFNRSLQNFLQRSSKPRRGPPAPPEGRACLSLGDQWKGTISMRTK